MNVGADGTGTGADRFVSGLRADLLFHPVPELAIALDREHALRAEDAEGGAGELPVEFRCEVGANLAAPLAPVADQRRSVHLNCEIVRKRHDVDLAPAILARSRTKKASEHGLTKPCDSALRYAIRCCSACMARSQNRCQP